jgi:peptide/nickel transport system permease protein
VSAHASGARPANSAGLLQVPRGLRVLLYRARLNRLGLLGVALVAFFVVMAFSVPSLSFDPFATTNEALQAPSVRHPMGTDDLGRDILSQLLWGSRVSLSVGSVAGVLATAVGVLVGAVSGYRGGWLDDLLMRVTEVFMILPRLLLAVVAVALIGAGMWNTIFVIGGLAWPGMARLIRAEVMSLRSRDFVEAARSLGQPQWRIIAREILPNALPLVIVNASLEIGAAIILEAGLSFLGLGDPNRMSWGTILNNAQRFLEDAWWMSVFPGTAIFLTVLGFNFAGDALNDVLDPQMGAA